MKLEVLKSFVPPEVAAPSGNNKKKPKKYYD